MSDIKWNEVLADKMTSEFYKHNSFGGYLSWVVNYTGVIRKGIWEKGVLRVLQEKAQNLQEHPNSHLLQSELELVRHWIYIIKMFVPKVEEHYTKEEYKAMQRGL
tara:strand:- start:547 stop:861 length:315 start_codon:yes stop_codon:yes gene_type:complete